MPPPPQVGDWKPYKGGKPPDPPPAGRGPVAGYTNPRFPSVGPSKVAVPAGGYQSIISTAPPIDAGQRKQIANVTAPYTSNRRTAGDQSRSAFARALTDTSSNALTRGTDQFNTDYRKQAEKSLSEDILAQRQNATDRFNMDMFKDIFDVDTSTRYTEGIKDGSQMFETEKRNEQAKRTAMIMRMIGSLL
jgi:hypothetical protein